MSLVISSEAAREAQRIIAARNVFEVLEINPRDCSKELVLSRYEEKAALFRRLFRNDQARQAKSALDNAKMRLSDDHLRQKELDHWQNFQSAVLKDREKLRALEERTILLETRAASLPT